MGGANVLKEMSNGDYGQPGIYGKLGLPAKDNMPGGRQEASSWTDTSGNLWLFGGKGFDMNGNLGNLNDLWEFKPSTNEWVWMGGSSTVDSAGVYGTIGTPAAGNIPGACSSASSWTDSIGHFWLLGCYAFWEFAPSTNQWAFMGGQGPANWGTLGVSVAGNFPGSRQNAASWTDSSGDLWLFGGEGSDSAANTGSLNDLWAFNIPKNEWAWMGGSNKVGNKDYVGQPGVYGTFGVPASGNIPGGRGGATPWTDKSGNFWLFGGNGSGPQGQNFTFNDLWKFQPPEFPVSAAVMPTFSVASGTYTSAQTVSLSDTTSGAAIYYTLDGSIPTTASPKYSAALTLSQTTTINAIAAAPGYANSAMASATYTINLPAAVAPTFSVASGKYTAIQTVKLSDTTKGATIYYTLDGSNPSTTSAKYSAALTVSLTTTIKAIAAASGYSNSAIATATYTINLPTAAAPAFKPAGGTYTSAQNVTITDTTTGAAIYYTTDGSTPSATQGAKYTSAIPVKTTETINAIATAINYNNSAVATASYTLHLPQTITFTQPTSPVTYGAKPITLSATSNSGLPVTLSLVSGPATLSGNTLTITGASSVVVAANQPGNTTYAAAPQVTKTITVNKAALTATAQKQSMTYGGPLPTLTYTLTGFVNSETPATATTGAPTLTTTAKASSPVGSYPITIVAGTLAAANYSFQFTASTLTVTKAALTVTANNLSMKQGAAVPPLTYTMTGFVNSDTQAKATTGVPKLTTTATSKSAPGTYPITVAAGNLAAANYTFTFASGTLTVTK